MLIKIKQPVTKKKLEAALKRLAVARKKRKVKGFDAKKFSGIIKWQGDAVALQRSWRDEWQ